MSKRQKKKSPMVERLKKVESTDLLGHFDQKQEDVLHARQIGF